MQRSKQLFPLIAGALVIIALISIVLSGNFPNDQKASGDASEEQMMTKRNFEGIYPDDWAHTSRAEKAVQALQDGQEINFNVVQSPVEENIYYFATTAYFNEYPPEGKLSVLGSIYKYNADTFEFERIYRKTIEQGAMSGLHDQALPIFHVMGYDNGRIVVLARDTDYSPGPCSRTLMFGRQADDIATEMLSIDLAAPFEKGLEPYRVPDDVYESEVEEQEECLENMNW